MALRQNWAAAAASDASGNNVNESFIRWTTWLTDNPDKRLGRAQKKDIVKSLKDGKASKSEIKAVEAIMKNR